MAKAQRGFDLTTHKRNRKGQITHNQPYRLHVKDGVQKFERPPGSGHFYAANGELLESPNMKAAAKKKHAKDAPALSEQEKAELKKLADAEMAKDENMSDDVDALLEDVVGEGEE